MSKEAEEYLIKEWHTNINGVIDANFDLKEESLFTYEEAADLMETYHQSQLKKMILSDDDNRRMNYDDLIVGIKGVDYIIKKEVFDLIHSISLERDWLKEQIEINFQVNRKILKQ